MKKEFTRLAQQLPHLRHDPFIRSMIHREQREEELEKMKPMSMRPGCSGWIYLLQNRVNLQSSGNINLKTRVWYDRCSGMVGTTRDDCNIPWPDARLKNGWPAQGWMYDE